MRKKIVLYSIGIIVVVIVVVFTGSKILDKSSSADKKKQQMFSVKLTSLERGAISKKLSLTGEIVPVQQTNIYSRVNGNIQNIYADIGQYVGKGKLLAVIDKSQYQQTLKQTESVMLQVKATVENNTLNYDRIQKLFEKGLTTQSELDNALTTLRVSQAQYEAAKANYMNAKLQLSYCNITAPFGGYITKRLLDRGSLVSSQSTTQNMIFILSDISRLKIIVNVPEKYLTEIQKISQVNITTDAYPDDIFTGYFKTISQAIEPTSRTMPAEISFDNRAGLLKPGMFARIDAIIERRENAILLPSQCVLKDEKGRFIFTVNQESMAVKRYVETGLEEDNKIEIISGISEEEKIISTGQELVKENSKVKIIN